MFLRLRRCDEALEQVTQGTRLDPLYQLVNESVGSVYLDCGDSQRAIEVFDSVLAMHPAASSTRFRRAQALCRSVGLTTSGGGLQNLIAGSSFQRHFEDARFIALATRAGFPMPIREGRLSTRARTAAAGAP